MIFWNNRGKKVWETHPLELKDIKHTNPLIRHRVSCFYLSYRGCWTTAINLLNITDLVEAVHIDIRIVEPVILGGLFWESDETVTLEPLPGHAFDVRSFRLKVHHPFIPFSFVSSSFTFLHPLTFSDYKVQLLYDPWRFLSEEWHLQ